MTVLQNSGHLHCPYNQCGKQFEKPIVLTDSTRLLRETYYACPHCHLKIEVQIDPATGGVVSIQTAEKQVEMAPAQCKHYFGYLKIGNEKNAIPDECAVCPKVMQCFIRKF